MRTFQLWLCVLIIVIAVADKAVGSNSVGIPDSGVGSLITVEEVKRIMLEVRAQALDPVIQSSDTDHADSNVSGKEDDTILKIPVKPGAKNDL